MRPLFLLGLALLAMACHRKSNEYLRYSDSYHNTIGVEEQIRATGVSLSPCSKTFPGKGIMRSYRKKGSQTVLDTSFTLVYTESNQSGGMIIHSLVPTNSGLFKISTMINSEVQNTTLQFQNYTDGITQFDTEYSSLTINGSAENNDWLQYKLIYRGQTGSDTESTSIEFVNEFYLDQISQSHSVDYSVNTVSSQLGK